jgi:hypothetical protein
MFRNKIPETLKPGRLCNGMETPDHDYELRIAAPISGTSVAAHDSAGAWMMNAFAARPGCCRL